MLLTPLSVPATPLTALPSFAAMLRAALGLTAWASLDAAIRTRFAAPKSSAGLRFAGNMQQVYCSPVGWLIATLLAPLALVPARCAQNVAFTFQIDPGANGCLLKTRSFRWAYGAPFIFRSQFGCAPTLHERFFGGLGMHLKLRARDGALEFLDDGYFLEVAGYRINLPRWANPRFELVHRNLDEQRFQVLLKVSHACFGTLIYQRGEFSEDLGDATATDALNALH